MENEIVDDLLLQFKEHRQAVQDMIEDLETLRIKIDKMFPEGTLDKRYLRFFEEKVKSTTELYKTLLDMRKEIGKSLKEEIDIRRKIDKDEDSDGEGLEGIFDVRNLAKQVEKLQKKGKNLKEKVKVKVTKGEEKE